MAKIKTKNKRGRYKESCGASQTTPSPLGHVKTEGEASSLHTRTSSSPELKHTGSLRHKQTHLEPLVSKTLRMKLLLLISHPVYGLLFLATQMK